MGKILRGVSNESVWLKSLAEHDNVNKFVQLTCSERDFNHIHSSKTPFLLHHKNTVCLLCSTEKRNMVKGCCFRVKWGMADIVDPLLKAVVWPSFPWSDALKSITYDNMDPFPYNTTTTTSLYESKVYFKELLEHVQL